MPGFPTQLDGKRRRRQLEALRLQRDALRAQGISELGVVFDFVLPIERLSAVSNSRRKRLFPEEMIFWGWVSQILEGNCSCAEALTTMQRWYQSARLPPPSSASSSFCRARMRLSEDFLEAVESMIGERTEAAAGEDKRWRGLRLKAIDGTSFQLLDTAANQASYPQSPAQKPGCGFPIMGAVAVLDLASGQMQNVVTGSSRNHDARGLYQLRDAFGAEDLVIADRAFCSYELMAMLQQGGSHSLMRLHQKREAKLQWRSGRRIDANSREVIWTKPPKPGACGITHEQWSALPDTMRVRLVRLKAAGRDGKLKTMYLASSLLDPVEYPTVAIAALYQQRWLIEVKFRDLKSTLDLGRLRVKTPAMARKMLRVAMIAYNLVKLLQSRSIQAYQADLDEVSFKGTLDVICQFQAVFNGVQNRHRVRARRHEALHQRVRERLIPLRPGRHEPRAVKQRPKPFQYLTSHRAQFKEIDHRNRYRKSA